MVSVTMVYVKSTTCPPASRVAECHFCIIPTLSPGSISPPRGIKMGHQTVREIQSHVGFFSPPKGAGSLAGIPPWVLGGILSIDHFATLAFPLLIHQYIMATSSQISKKRKFIADGVFQAELGEFLFVHSPPQSFTWKEIDTDILAPESSPKRVTLDVRSESPTLELRSSSELPTPKRFSVTRDDESESSRLLSRSDSSSRKTLSSSTPRRSNSEVSLPSLKPSLCDTSSSVVLPCDGQCAIVEWEWSADE